MTDCTPSSNKGLAEFLRTKADGAGSEDAALFGLCARVIEASDEPADAPLDHCPHQTPPRNGWCLQCVHKLRARLAVPPRADLELMRKDAARYEWLRERWSGLVTTTAPGDGGSLGMWVVTLIETMKTHRPTDPQTLDHAIDAAMDLEDGAAETKQALTPEAVQDAITRAYKATHPDPLHSAVLDEMVSSTTVHDTRAVETNASTAKMPCRCPTDWCRLEPDNGAQYCPDLGPNEFCAQR